METGGSDQEEGLPGNMYYGYFALGLVAFLVSVAVLQSEVTLCWVIPSAGVFLASSVKGFSELIKYRNAKKWSGYEVNRYLVVVVCTTQADDSSDRDTESSEEG